MKSGYNIIGETFGDTNELMVQCIDVWVSHKVEPLSMSTAVEIIVQKQEILAGQGAQGDHWFTAQPFFLYK